MKNNQLKSIEERVLSLCRMQNADKVFVLTDSNVDRLTQAFLPDACRLVVEAGEGSKSITGAEKVWRFLEDNRALRRSLMVNVGGGMVSDLGGFAASTFKRGIRFVNLPTTLLAAVDASIGGKTGVNFMGLKNEIGSFAMPLAVLPLTSLFDTLPDEEWLSGVGEAVKTALLDGEDLYRLATSRDFIEKRSPTVVEEVVRRCAAFKSKVVEEDFKENGRRKILNLGHTAGHAVEALRMRQGKYIPHGIAVAYGLLEALKMSVEREGFEPRLAAGYEEILKKYFPPLHLSREERELMKEFMGRDKKNTKEGEVAWVLLRRIGEPVV